MASLRLFATNLKLVKNVTVLSTLRKYKVVLNQEKHMQISASFFKSLGYKSKPIIRDDPDKFGTLQDERQWKTEFEPDDYIQEKEKERLENRTGEKRKRTIDYIYDIKNLARENKVKEALKLYEHLFKINVRPDEPLLFVVIISMCGKVGYTKKAFQVLKDMTDRKFRPTAAALTGLFNSCGNCPFPEYGLQKARLLRGKIAIKGWHPNNITYQAMIKAFGKCGDMETAFELVDEMNDNRMAITTETFSFLLMSCITDKEAGFGYALKVLQKMEKLRIKPNVYSFNLLLRASRDCNMGPPELQAEILQDFMLQANRPQLLKIPNQDTPDQMKLNTDNHPKTINVKFDSQDQRNQENQNIDDKLQVIAEADKNALKLLNKPEHELVAIKTIENRQDRLMLLGGTNGILEKMRKLNVKPDIKTFTILLVTQEHTKKNELALLDEMRKANVKVDTDFFNVLIKQRATDQRYHDARDVLHLMIVHNVKPDIATFGTLTMTCHNASEAARYLRDMEDANFQPNIQIMGHLARNAKFNMDFDLALYVIKKLSLLNMKPDSLLVETLEKMRANGREVIYKLEKNMFKTNPRFVHDKFEDEYTKFCKVFANWAERTEVELPEHPWNQYDTKIKD